MLKMFIIPNLGIVTKISNEVAPKIQVKIYKSAGKRICGEKSD